MSWTRVACRSLALHLAHILLFSFLLSLSRSLSLSLCPSCCLFFFSFFVFSFPPSILSSSRYLLLFGRGLLSCPVADCVKPGSYSSQFSLARQINCLCLLPPLGKKEVEKGSRKTLSALMLVNVTLTTLCESLNYSVKRSLKSLCSKRLSRLSLLSIYSASRQRRAKE